MLDDSIKNFEYINSFMYCKYNDLYTKKELKIIYTNDKLSYFLDVPVNTKTNLYTILKRVNLYIKNNNLCINGVIKPDKKLSNILVPNYKYNRITYNTILKYIKL